MHVSAKYSKLKHWKSELTCVFMAKNEPVNFWKNELDEIYDDTVSKLLKSREFGADEDKIFILVGNAKTSSKRIALIGLGDYKDVESETLRRAAAKAIRTAMAMEYSKVTLAFPAYLRQKNWTDDRIAQALTEGACLAHYKFDKYHTDKKPHDRHRITELTIIADHEPTAALQHGLHSGVIISDAVNFARDLGNAPGNELPPRELADRAAAMCRKHKIKCTVFNETKLKSLKMGGILGVTAGSAEPPRLVIMEYKAAKSKNSKPIVLVGKGLTFDSGGISIKPADQMDRMKFDMCGGAAVIGIMQAIAELKLPLYVIGIVPSSENLTGSRAYKPGDVLTMYSGKTVEIINTDAEGRLILADALAYAQRYKPEMIIDYATLTGHCVIALGTHGAGLFSTDTNLKQKLIHASEASGEKIWELPLWKEFDKQIKSHIADIKNTGGRPGGASTAAAFLKHFVGDTPWAHLDIAGTANSEEEQPYTDRISATGFGVRLTVEMLRHR